MKPFLRAAAVVAVLASACPPARAQMSGMSGMGDSGGMGSSHIVSVGLGAGVSVPTSDAKDAFKTGWNGQGFVRLNLKLLPIAPRVDFTFQRFDLKSAMVNAPELPTITGHGQIFAGVANLQFYLLNRGPIRPYVVAGLGAYNFKTETDSSKGYGSTSNSSTKLGINGGGGVLFRLGNLLSAYVEGRVDNVYTDKGLVDAKQIKVIPVTLGVVIWP